MRLRTTAGAYAGEIRDYPFSVAQAALKVGSAVLVEQDPAPLVITRAAPVAPAPVDRKTWRPHKRK